MKLRIGTRGSKLALWQAYHIAHLLNEGDIDTEIITIETRGDKKLDVSIAEIGSKGVFTEEIENQLSCGSIDIAVHSAKDMQSELPEDYELIAFTKREKVNDVLVSHNQALKLDDSSRSWVIGTSSARRKALLKHFYPHVKTVEMRGNLQTRIGKMENGACDAMLLAYAGVHRMGYHDMIIHEFHTRHFIPAVGQGSIAVEALCKLEAPIRQKIQQLVADKVTTYQLQAERAFLKTLRGGCSIPVFALAQIENKQINLRGGIISLDGNKMLKEQICGPLDTAELLGNQLAQSLLGQGGDQMLKEIRKQMNA
jgi:hydroxymethylbilane synthase